MENRVLFDWFSCTFDTRNPYYVTELLGVEVINWQEIQGMYGYKKRLYYDGISIHYDGSVEQGCWLEMSGKGCRTFEDFSSWDWISFCAHIVRDTCLKNFTRIDIACDIFNEVLDLDILSKDTLAGNYVAKFHDYQLQMGNKGTTIYHGSPKSLVRIRIYDKSAEQKTNFSWVRCEIQLRSERASEFIFQFIDCQNLTDLYLGVISHYLRYVVATSDSNKRRWPTASYWSAFIGAVSAIDIVSHIGTEYTFDNLQNYVVNQAGGAIKTLISLVGFDEFKKMIIGSHSVLNPKYSDLIYKLKQPK